MINNNSRNYLYPIISTFLILGKKTNFYFILYLILIYITDFLILQEVTSKAQARIKQIIAKINRMNSNIRKHYLNRI